MGNASQFDGWLREFVAKADHPWVQNSEEMIKYLIEFDKELPSEYGWRVTSREAFREQIVRTSSAEDANRCYWQDMARQIEAYGVMLIWRSTELVRPTVELLNAKEIIAPAVLSRSLLELGSSALINSNTINQTIKEVLAEAEKEVVVLCEELENILLRIIHGTRLGEPADHLKQTNALTYIQKMAKKRDQGELLNIYQNLCEVTHPNVLGNARFWASIISRNEDGSETVKMERHGESVTTGSIRKKILWALGWSGVSITNSFRICRDSVQMIMERWPREGG